MPDYRFKTGSEHLFVIGILNNLEVFDMWVAVRYCGNPVKVVVFVGIGIFGQIQLFPPSVDEGKPEII